MTRPITVITGALGTIGRNSAKKLSAAGHSLLLIDRNEEGLKNLSQELPNCAWNALDITNPEAVKNLFDKIAGEIESVILCAGIEGPIGNFEDIDDQEFQKVMSVNVFGVWLCMKYALRALKARKSGSIVALSSISGTKGMPTMSPYCASKHAVIGLVRTAAREAAAFNVRVNAVCPGPVASEMMTRIDASLLENNPERFKGRADASASVPMQRYARPEEIADMILFLCSDASSYVTGTTLMVDGGLTCR